jgi:hypothetical protein
VHLERAPPLLRRSDQLCANCVGDFVRTPHRVWKIAACRATMIIEHAAHSGPPIQASFRLAG